MLPGQKHAGREGPRWRGRCAVVASTMLLGCGSGSTPNVGDPGTISGKAGGKSVDIVASAYFIGASDDPTHTTVVYVFDKAVSCVDLGSAGWDQVITDGTGALEMKLIGVAPGKYAVAAGATPGQGEAAVNFTVSSTSATPKETASNGGSVQLDTLDPENVAKGTFDLQFPDGTLKGTFAAAWCADGHEP